MSEKRIVGLRWLKIDRELDFITKKKAKLEEVREWEEYQRTHPDAENDRDVEYSKAPFETPHILCDCRDDDGKLVGYVRSYAPIWEAAEYVHEDLVRQWEETEVYKALAAENDW